MMIVAAQGVITEAILNVLTAPFVWLLDSIPTIDWPGWMTDGAIGSTASDVGAKLASLDAWVPGDDLVTVSSFIVVAWGVALVIRGLRLPW
jgi:hypothetical protein